MGEVVTFYSYKGGVGRTMALANSAVLLARWGHKVLIVDWDLEAPGLEFYFKDYIDPHTAMQQAGIVELLHEQVASAPSTHTWQQFVLPVLIDQHQKPIHFLTAGTRDESYFRRLRELDLRTFYREQGGADFIESLRNEWRTDYDYVLVDSRTGITDIGGICTIQLPDILILMFTANEQSLEGVLDIARRAVQAQQQLPFERLNLITVPIAARFDAVEEFTISQNWLDRFAQSLGDLYANWLPRSVRRREFIEVTKIPYIAYFSFGEKLPVIEQGTSDPGGLGYAYETLAGLIANRLESVEQLMLNRGQFIQRSLKHGPLRVFLSYVRQDRTVARELYQRLLSDGFDVWFGEEDLLPGQNWRSEMRRAMDTSDAVIICLSYNAMGGRINNKEYELVLDIAEKQPESRLIIPLKLDESEVPEPLSHLHAVNLFEAGGYERLVRALHMYATTVEER